MNAGSLQLFLPLKYSISTYGYWQSKNLKSRIQETRNISAYAERSIDTKKYTKKSNKNAQQKCQKILYIFLFFFCWPPKKERGSLGDS